MAIPCVGAVIADASGRLVLVQRAHAPHAGLWSLPGGRVEPGETHEQAVVREVAEETGLQVRVLRRIGRVALGDYDVVDFACEVVGGILGAASDAADAVIADPRTLDCTPRLVETLVGWGVLSGAYTAPAEHGQPGGRVRAVAAVVILAALPLLLVTIPASMVGDSCRPGGAALACSAAAGWLPGLTLVVGLAAPALALAGALAGRRWGGQRFGGHRLGSQRFGGQRLVTAAGTVTAVTWVCALAVLESA